MMDCVKSGDRVKPEQLKLGAIKFGLSMGDGEESGNAKGILYILSIK